MNSNKQTLIDKCNQAGVLYDYLDYFIDVKKTALSNNNKKMHSSLIDQAINFVEEISGIILTTDQLKDIFSLYPIKRSKLMEYGLEGETEMRELVANVLSDYLVGREWPTYGDKLNISSYIYILREQAKKLNFEIDEDFEN